MTILISGKIKNLVPSFNGIVNKHGVLVIKGNGSISITVDTGFNGALALPEKILKEMDVELIDYGVFRLATGEEVNLPVFWGKVAVKKSVVETWFVPGDSLLGMEFLSLIGSSLNIDFKKQKVTLAR